MAVYPPVQLSATGSFSLHWPCRKITPDNTLFLYTTRHSQILSKFLPNNRVYDAPEIFTNKVALCFANWSETYKKIEIANISVWPKKGTENLVLKWPCLFDTHCLIDSCLKHTASCQDLKLCKHLTEETRYEIVEPKYCHACQIAFEDDDVRSHIINIKFAFVRPFLFSSWLFS